MVTAYFNCSSGISGNMILGSFLAAGLELEDLKQVLSTLPVKGYELEVKDVIKQGISAKHLNVKLIENQPHRHLHHIEEIINKGQLPLEVKELALKIFRRLAEAEARVHGTSIEKVHFHEVGAVDAIVDIVGAAYGVYKLGINKVYASPLNVGKGTVKCAHGQMPIPAPATAELLTDAVTYTNEVSGELVTPTGAAIITTLTSNFGDQPLLKIKKVAYGAGTWDLIIPNVLRLTLAEEVKNLIDADKSMVIETNIDDMNPEFYDYLMEKLFAAGAVDVYFIPVQMKKNRPGTLISITSNLPDHSPIIEVLLKETTTLGLRMYPVGRVKLIKEYQELQTPWGKVKVKLGKYNGKIVNIKPEYEDCKAIAKREGIPLKEVWQKVYATLQSEIIK
ncbi:MAG: pyridinium-3,5-bisthiocarboxylic acid mononucleotide nickel chelatase [Clostridia bacterium]|nr:pyridinium-3,5-bisthiocarboxylic acid mononucleotide nickel chelatase [Clostridia bacterium]MDN5322585.1 pyridinium-3,5-bisthiocarboxylic acid mononucleotide nickel chelatase [Clostridia bacterium]